MVFRVGGSVYVCKWGARCRDGQWIWQLVGGMAGWAIWQRVSNGVQTWGVWVDDIEGCWV